MGETRHRIVAILLIATGLSVAAAALAQSEPPMRTCVVKCGGEVISELKCDSGQFCCQNVDCTTGLFAQNCCSQTEDCEKGTDPETGAPFADCVASP